MNIKELTNEEFNNFKNSFEIKSIYQTPEYGFVMNHQNFDSIFLGLVDQKNNVLGASLILIQNLGKVKYAYAPRGFLIDYKDSVLLEAFTKEIKKYLSKLNVIAIKISPIVTKTTYDKKYNVLENNPYYDVIFNNLKKLGFRHLGYNDYFESIKPRFETIIDIDKPYYLLFKNIRKEFRTKIRSAEEKGVSIYKGNANNLEYLYLQTKKKYPRDLNYFKDCYGYFGKNGNIEFYYSKLNTEKYLQITNKNLQEQEKICNQYNDIIGSNKNIITAKIEADKLYNKYKNNLIQATKLLRNYPDGIVTSSVLVVKNNDEIYMLMDGFDPVYKKFNSKHLLIWKLMEKFSNEGYKKFNLGGISNPMLENNKYQGLVDFKLGFNAKAIEYIGDLELICNNALYFMYKNTPIKAILKK